MSRYIKKLLARHFWPDGTMFDLAADPEESAANVTACFGKEAATEFATFQQRAARLLDAFDRPVMQTSSPGILALAAHVMRAPGLILDMDPLRTLQHSLKRQFSEPKLVQLFGRYATYVGGSPSAAPALLSLISQAEAQGVWYIEGGMHALADAIAERAQSLGAEFHFDAHVERIELDNGRPSTVRTTKGHTPVDAVVYNGDPRALRVGMLGDELKRAVSGAATEPRSLSAYVHSFAASAQGLPLAAHNVLFCANSHDEFDALARNQRPQDATLYICAQDRFGGKIPEGVERFEIISNAPPSPDRDPLLPEEKATCHSMIMDRLTRFGLQLDPVPPTRSLTMPQEFAAMFPASNGSLYGRSPHGMTATFKRPTVRSKIPGLYLVGGGVHPGAGVPMATLCAAHAAEAMRNDRILISTSPQGAMLGGMSTESRMMESAPSRSSAS